MSERAGKQTPLYKSVISSIIPFIIVISVLFLPLLLITFLLGIFFTGHKVEALYYTGYQLIFLIIIYIIYIIYNSFKDDKVRNLCSMMDIMILNFIGVVLFNMFAPNFYTAKQLGYLKSCEINLKNMGMCLELYAKDNKGHYPSSLDKILIKSGRYKPLIEKIPFCYARHDRDNKLYNKRKPEDTSPHYRYTVSYMRDNFTLWCNTPGIHVKSKEVSRNGCWPQYSSRYGLLLAPASQVDK